MTVSREILKTPSFDSVISLDGSQILGKNYLLKSMVKNTDEQPNEKIHRAGSGKVLSAGASLPMELHRIPSMWMCSPTQQLSKFLTLGNFKEASSCRDS